VAFPGKIFAVSNVPIRVPLHFLGRGDSLAAIETVLTRGGSILIGKKYLKEI
jgi:hypothetical protein